jgi:tetratricopeptide (TPR) repeat protein
MMVTSVKKSLAATLLGLTATAFALCLALGAQERHTPLDTITEALRAGQYDQALRMTAEALQKSPGDPRLYVLQGTALSGKGSVDEARIAYQRALQHGPKYVPALESAAQLEYQAGSDRALPLLTRLLALQPGKQTAQAMMGALAYKSHDCAAATKYYRLANPAVASNPSALREYGACLMKMNREEAAVSVWRQLLLVRPADRYAAYALAQALCETGHPEEALTTLKPLLENGVLDSNGRMLISSAYEAIGDTPRAVSTLRQAIVASPENEELYLQFADLSLAHRSYQAGIAMLDAGLSQMPNAASLYIARGVLYAQVMDYDKAQADFDTANRLEHDLVINSGVAGLLQTQKNDLDRALSVVRRQLEQKPDSAYAQYLLAEIILRRGAVPGSSEFHEAEQAAMRAIELEPAMTEARDVLADLYLRSGRPSQAIEQSRLALADDPNDRSAVFHLISGLRTSQGSNQEEIQRLVKRLAELEERERKQEAQRNRFMLIEPEAGVARSTPRQINLQCPGSASHSGEERSPSRRAESVPPPLPRVQGFDRSRVLAKPEQWSPVVGREAFNGWPVSAYRIVISFFQSTNPGVLVKRKEILF